MLARVLLLLFFLANIVVAGAADVITNQRVRLGTPGFYEWEEFSADRASTERAEFRFQAESNAGEGTLFISQQDVKQGWRVQLNGREVGRLSPMEAALVHWLPIPVRALKTGENVLAIFPVLPESKDDIVIHRIVLDPRSPKDAISRAKLRVRVTDQNGEELPCRITVADQDGTLAALIPLSNAERLAARSGVVYTGDGRAEMGLLPGRYTVFASRGFEYGVARQVVELGEGKAAEVRLTLTREVPTPGLVSCDPHIHTLTLSRHGDATTDERMLTLAGEHIELPIATDHNLHAEFNDAAERMGMRRWFTPVSGNEITTKKGHFNAFPVEVGGPVADASLTDWPKLMESIRRNPAVRFVILNHPRSIHNGYRPFDPANFNSVTGDNKAGPEFSFDGIEILNSGAQQTDYMLVYRDWFALLNRGYRITAVGGSDSHDVSRFIVGQARTYIEAPDGDPATIDVDRACESLRRGCAMVSMGLLPLIKVEEKFGCGDLATGLPDSIIVSVKVLGPSWVSAGQVDLFANGERIRSANLAHSATVEKGVKGNVTWTIPRPKHDVHLVAIATGPAVTEPFWAMTKPYQPQSPKWEGRAIGSTNPVWVDADGDGKFSSARDYARQVISSAGRDMATIVRLLERFDQATAAQAASLLTSDGIDIARDEFQRLLKDAPAPVKSGFDAFQKAASLPSQ